MESSHQNPQAVTVATPITSVLLDKKTLSARLGLSPRTLEKMVKDGAFPPGVRVGRFLYWTEAVVAVWKGRLFASQHTWNPVLA
jgi:predicted DNA-binding transcriptional regulator AlpA